MKTTLILSIILLSAFRTTGQSKQFTLPGEWDKTFVISIDHTGSMSGGQTHLKITYDSCSYIATSLRSKPKKIKFPLKPADRVAILKKMNELRVEFIKTESSIVAQYDGWSELLCIGDHCIEGGSRAEMNETSKNIFSDATHYLEEFATNSKARQGKK